MNSKSVRSIKAGVLPLAVALALGACGGGGGGGTAVVPSTGAPVISATVPLDSALGALFASAHTFDRTETDPATRDVLAVKATYLPGPDFFFEGVSTNTADVTRNLSRNNVPFSPRAERTYFQLNPYKPIGTTYPDSSLYVVASNQVPLPATGTAGNFGKFYDTITYDSPAKTAILARTSVTWQINADTATTVNLCVNSVITATGLPGTTVKFECYKIDSSGNVVSVAFSIPG